MSVALINPKFSFLQFASAAVLQNACAVPLPVIQDDDIKFQFLLKYTGPIYSVPDFVNLYAVKPNAVITTAAQLVAATTADLSAVIPTIKQVKPDTLLISFSTPLVGLIAGLAANECFKFCLSILPDCNTQPLYFVSNCFQKSNDIRYTATLDYNCDENAYDFDYCNGYTGNKIRLPFFLKKPQFKDETSIYVRSDGSRKVHKAVTFKEYEAVTKELDEYLHEKFDVALNHDNVTVNSYRYQGGIRKEGDYDIAWIEFLDEELATAKFKLFATPYNVRNSNCEVCEPVNFPALSPCPTIINCAQLISLVTSKNTGATTWAVNIISCAYTSGTVPASNQLVDITYREAGTSGAYTSAGTITFDATGAIVGTPSPFVIANILNSWVGVEIVAINQCGGNPFTITVTNSPCNQPLNLQIIDLQPNFVSIAWDRILPIPSGGYDWQLKEIAGGIEASGTGYLAVGNPVILDINGVNLIPGNQYEFLVKTNCGGGNYSNISVITFTAV